MTTQAQDVRSSRILRLLGAADVQSLASDLAWLQSGDCEGSKHHSPSPLLIRPYYLSTMVAEAVGTSTTHEEGLVYLCSTCRDNLTVYLSILYAYDGATPQAVRRDFGNIILSLGDRAWSYWEKHDGPVTLSRSAPKE